MATMLGCETLASRRGSRSRSPKSRFCRCGTLIATCLSIQVSRARYTVPNPPLPSGDRILYLPRICPWNSIRPQYTAAMSLPRFHHDADRSDAGLDARSSTAPRRATLDARPAAARPAIARVRVRRRRRRPCDRGRRRPRRAASSCVCSSRTPPAASCRSRSRVAPAVLKGDAMDAARSATRRCSARSPSPRSSRRARVVPARARRRRAVVERWRRVALASAKQCGRSVLPAIAPARPLDAALRDPAWADATRLILCEPSRAASAEPAVDPPAMPATARRRAVRARGRLDTRGSGARRSASAGGRGPARRSRCAPRPRRSRRSRSSGGCGGSLSS